MVSANLSCWSIRQAFPNAVTADGKTLIFRALSSGSVGNDILTVSLAGDRKVIKLVATDHDELNAVLSPDNQWIAYQSDLSGRMEIYVRPFPNVDGGQTLISTSGGTEPLWAPDGREIFYRSADNKLMSVGVTGRRELLAEKPKLLFDMASYSDLHRQELRHHPGREAIRDGQGPSCLDAVVAHDRSQLDRAS